MNPHPRTPASSFRALTSDLPPLETEVSAPMEDRIGLIQSVGMPSRPILGLPLARLIPQDVHSIMDYANGLMVASCMMMTDDRNAKFASMALASSVVGVSAMTDYRLSAAKLIPIEGHEVIDHAWGLACIAAPFALGYWKRAPHVALMHVVAGVGTIISSLITDYRAFSRRTRSKAAAR